MKPRPTIRLGLFHPDPDVRGVYFTGRRMADTPKNRRVARLAIVKYNKLAEGDPAIDWCLGLFCVRSVCVK